MAIPASVLAGGPPTNDECSGATELTPSALCAPTAGTTEEATESTAPITCNGFTSTMANDVWYSFVATETEHIIYVTGSGGYDAIVQFFEGTCAGLDSLDCADETLADDTETINTTGLTIGSTYYFRTYSWNGVGTIHEACVTTVSDPPVNDDCSGVTAQNLIVGGSVVYNGDNLGATDDGQGLDSPQAWEAFTTTECLDITVEYCGTASIFEDAFFELFDGCPFTNAVAATSSDTTSCNDANWTIGFIGVPAGTWYYAVLAELGSMGPYSITVSGVACAPPPVNDDCAGATELTPGGATCVPTVGTTLSSTESLAPITCNGFTSPMANDVWYSFVATETSHDIMVTGSGGYDAIIQFFEGTCGGLDSLSCADATLADATETINATGLTIGTTYYFRTYAWNGLGTEFEACVVSAAEPPANSDCSNAESITVNDLADCPANSISGTTEAALHDGNDPDCDVTTAAFLDVWYTFNSGNSTEVNVDFTAGTATDLVLEVLDGCLGNSVFCTTTDPPPYAVAVDPNTDYLVRMFTNTQFGSGGEFTLCVSTDKAIGINEFGSDRISIFPNPASSSIIIRNSGQSLNANIELVDMSGKVVLAQTSVLAGDHNLDITSLAPGMYMLNMYNEDGLNAHHRVMVK